MIIDNFIKRANSRPNLIAIEYDSKSYTYGDLKEMVWDFASYFQNDLKIKENQCVVVWFNPSIEFIATVLALYCIGAYYLPVHEDFTLERKKFLVGESDKDFILTNFNTNSNCIKCINIKNEKNKEAFIKIVGKYAYRIYTSGSTGEPKGVQITQKNLDYILYNLNELFPCLEGDSYLLKTPFSFDVSVVEIFGWILGNAKLVIPTNEKLKLFSTLADDVINNKVTHLTLSPTMISSFIPLVSKNKLQKIDDTLKYIILASEELPVATANNLMDIFKKCQIINAYGPTETTVYCTYYLVDRKLEQRVPIGKPFYGIDIYFEKRDEYDFPELLISGKGCSPGYWKNPTRNKESFVKRNGKRYYRTGDLVEQLQDGNLVFRGRIDSQIQINGIRTEIGEIEYLISKIEPITRVAVVYVNSKILCFYSTKIPIDAKKIDSLLRKTLPSYMMPNFLYNIDSFPVTLNGKIDKKSLVKELDNKRRKKVSNAASQSETLRKVKSVFSKVFDLPLNSINDDVNFFNDLGGDSLRQMVLLTELEETLNQNFTTDFISRYPTPIDITNKVLGNMHETKNYIEDLIRYEIDYQIKVTNALFFENDSLLEVNRYQRNYLKNNFNEILSLIIPVENSNNWLTFRKNLNYILQNSDALASVVIKENDSYFLKNKLNLVDFHIPTVTIAKRQDGIDRDKQIIDNIVKQHISQNQFDSMLFRTFFIESAEKKYLYFAISHLICDLGSINLIKNQLLSPSVKISGKFFDYITFIRTKSNIEDFKNLSKSTLSSLFPKTEIIHSEVDERLIVSEIGKIKLKNKSIEELIIEANYMLCRILNSVFHINSNIVSSTILSIREYSDGRKFDTIGDFHSSFAFTYLEGENLKSYRERCMEILSILKNGNQFQVAIEKAKNDELNQRFRNSQNLKTDFLGIIPKSETNDIYKEVIQFKSDFKDWLQSSRVRVNMFINGDKLYAIWLNEPINLKETLEKNSIPYYDILKDDWN